MTDFRQELKELIDRRLDPASIFSHYRILQALEGEMKRLNLATNKFPDNAEAVEEEALGPEALKDYYEREHERDLD